MESFAPVGYFALALFCSLLFLDVLIDKHISKRPVHWGFSALMMLTVISWTIFYLVTH